MFNDWLQWKWIGTVILIILSYEILKDLLDVLYQTLNLQLPLHLLFCYLYNYSVVNIVIWVL